MCYIYTLYIYNHTIEINLHYNNKLKQIVAAKLVEVFFESSINDIGVYSLFTMFLKKRRSSSITFLFNCILNYNGTKSINLGKCSRGDIYVSLLIVKRLLTIVRHSIKIFMDLLIP